MAGCGVHDMQFAIRFYSVQHPQSECRRVGRLRHWDWQRLYWEIVKPIRTPGADQPSVRQYVYTKAPALAVGQTITLNYSVDGGATFAPADVNEQPPATVSLFFWRGGDNLSGQDEYVCYRWFCTQKVLLQLGDNQTLSCQVAGAEWVSVFGENGANSAASQAGFAAALKYAAYAGTSFSGKFFAGHGVWTTSGSATFTIKSYTIQ
jgi:hypothetical protein